MSEPLVAPAPGFDQPIAMLKHCHDRIRKQLKTLESLQQHLDTQGQSVDAQQAAAAVLRYFRQAAPNHHADEEENLLPMLEQTAAGEDAATFARLVPGILDEHKQMERCWEVLERELEAVAQGQSATLTRAETERFAALYLRHMEVEEGHIAPMAKRLFSPEQIKVLGDAMRERRGIGEEDKHVAG